MASHPVDVHVGKRLRLRRTLLGMSQEDLGESVGITFQQIQKYERGLNRIGSSRLYEFSRILSVPVSYFFEEFSETDEAIAHGFAEEPSPFEYEQKSNKEVLSLVRAYSSIQEPQVRKKVLSLVKSLAGTEEEEDGDDTTPSSSAKKKAGARVEA